MEVLDALGRLVLTSTLDAEGSATLTLPTGLPAGLYVVRHAGQAQRLLLE